MKRYQLTIGKMLAFESYSTLNAALRPRSNESVSKKGASVSTAGDTAASDGQIEGFGFLVSWRLNSFLSDWQRTH